MIPASAPTNRLALASFVSALFTCASFCVGFAPIPLTAWVCYPLAILLASLALVTGFAALRQMRVSAEKGRGMALLGIWTGSLTILAVICLTTLTILLIYYGADYINTIWPQLKP